MPHTIITLFVEKDKRTLKAPPAIKEKIDLYFTDLIKGAERCKHDPATLISGIAEITVNGIEYQIQMTLNSNKDEWAHEEGVLCLVQE